MTDGEGNPVAHGRPLQSATPVGTSSALPTPSPCGILHKAKKLLNLYEKDTPVVSSLKTSKWDFLLDVSNFLGEDVENSPALEATKEKEGETSTNPRSGSHDYPQEEDDGETTILPPPDVLTPNLEDRDLPHIGVPRRRQRKSYPRRRWSPIPSHHKDLGDSTNGLSSLGDLGGSPSLCPEEKRRREEKKTSTSGADSTTKQYHPDL